MAPSEVSPPIATSLADVGLLILRVGVGATMIQAGLRKAFDFDTAVGSMESGGYRCSPHSWSPQPKRRVA